ncbi:hypothetical protein OG884_12210 [Streptosporangium sp. NBC_01755]|uniref:hypothetical protein n=1 Tax=unclassified Streptosporangium TaxID=2632669 RepID=UPI002DD972CF|nr:MULTISPECIES: hypothetical protein [unclassified Streptosporangium]WSA25988.1 hypothetical protein OIE13_34680 [Streptosporangium sp. NBC_01810]WSD02626.1 hypothetical protein OG884_12210 [Streptosporangium sp. NBC_01755]
MKRVIASVTAATAALLVAATPAQAAPAPADPVKALKSRLVVGKGVKFTELSTMKEEGKTEPYVRRTGSFQFGRAGIVASDISSKGAAPVDPRDGQGDGMFAPARTIRIGTTSYSQGGTYRDKMPSGKSWYKTPNGMTGGVAGWFSQLVNVAEPTTLAALLKDAKQTRNTYTGTTTFGRLAKVSPWFRATLPLRSSDKTVVTFKLTVDRNRLPQHLTTSFPVTGIFDSTGWEGKTISAETRFTGWGSRVSIKPPPANKVTTKLEDRDGLP